jgi:hypothetical protein
MKKDKVKLTWHNIGTFHGDLNAWILEAKYRGENYIFKVAQSWGAGIVYNNYFRDDSDGAFEEYLTSGNRLDERLESIDAYEDEDGDGDGITTEHFIKLFVSAGGDEAVYKDNYPKFITEGRA